ncbi:uncharacterized protein LOC6568021 [Drosophila grimshawi]|uniref:GH17307 n=1 Tax=Drosophila grimshawi TaxID=7222 RepID=B4JUK0_DROGR|nr:uncharacterized protein LOC6568021 [Drosophila grimshawi]EDV91170.1 GH17307 [Drosophila grimshawi]
MASSSTHEVCRAAGLPLCEPESSTSVDEVHPFRKILSPQPAKTLLCDCVFGDDGDDDEGGESELSLEQPLTEGDDLQLEDIQDELDKKKAFVDLIGKRLSLQVPDCPIGDVCVDKQLELNNFDTHPEILELQRNNHKLSLQIRALQHSCTATDASLKHLRMLLDRELEAAVVLQRRLDRLDSVRRTMEHEQALCRQRYRHLQEDKYEWQDCHAYIKRSREEASLELVKFVPRLEYIQPKHDAVQLLNQTKRLGKELHEFLVENMARLSLRLGLRASTGHHAELGNNPRLGTFISEFLQRNERLFTEATP